MPVSATVKARPTLCLLETVSQPVPGKGWEERPGLRQVVQSHLGQGDTVRSKGEKAENRERGRALRRSPCARVGRVDGGTAAFL